MPKTNLEVPLKKKINLTDKIDQPLDLYTHLPFQIAVVSNLMQLNRDSSIRDLSNLDPRELRVILNIGSYMPIKAADIAYQARLDSYTISRAVKKLSSEGLVDFENDPTNKKVKYLILTKRGEILYRKLCKQIESRTKKLEEVLDEQEKNVLMKLLSRLESRTVTILADNAMDKLKKGETIGTDQKEIIRWHKKIPPT